MDTGVLACSDSDSPDDDRPFLAMWRADSAEADLSCVDCASLRAASGSSDADLRTEC